MLSLPRRRPLYAAEPSAERPDQMPDASVAGAPVSPLGVREQQALLQTAFAGKAAAFPFAARFAVLNLIGLACIAAAWAEGLLFKPYAADTSGMCYLMTILLVAVLVAVALKDWQTVRCAGNALLYLGMVGYMIR